MERVIGVDPDRAALAEAVGLMVRQVIPPALRWPIRLLCLVAPLPAYLGGASAGAWVADRLGAPSGQGGAILGVLAVLALHLAIQALDRWLLGRLRDNRFALAPRTWRLGPEGLSIEGRDARVEARWRAVEAVVRGRRGLSVTLAGSAWVLPRGAFASEAEMAEVEALLRERVASAQA